MTDGLDVSDATWSPISADNLAVIGVYRDGWAITESPETTGGVPVELTTDGRFILPYYLRHHLDLD